MTPRNDSFAVPPGLRRHILRDEDQALESALFQIDHMCEHIGCKDLGAIELLDFGCGSRFTRALISQSLPIKRYVGVDVFRRMIHWLRTSVDDPRFEYFHINAHNALYNPKGEILTEETELPIAGQTFDVICLFSVFSHLGPRDYRTLLKLLRRHVKPDGKLFYTLFINELTERGNGLMDKWWANLLGRLSPEELTQAIERHRSTEPQAVEPYKELSRESPMRWPVYSEQYARDLIAGTGWEVLTLDPPIGYVRQHHFVCAPTREMA